MPAAISQPPATQLAGLQLRRAGARRERGGRRLVRRPADRHLAGLDRESADRFAAVASGLIGLAYGAAGRFGGGAVNEVIIEMENAFIFVTGISDGSCLAVVADGDVRRRPRRLRDGGAGREGRRRPDPRAPRRAPEQRCRAELITGWTHERRS